MSFTSTMSTMSMSTTTAASATALRVGARRSFNVSKATMYEGPKRRQTRLSASRRTNLRTGLVPYLANKDSLFAKLVARPSPRDLLAANVAEYVASSKTALMNRIDLLRDAVAQRDATLAKQVASLARTHTPQEAKKLALDGIDTSLDEELRITERLLRRLDNLVAARATTQNNAMTWRETFAAVVAATQTCTTTPPSTDITLHVRFRNFAKNTTDFCVLPHKPYTPKKSGYPGLLVLAEGVEADKAREYGAQHVGGKDLLDQVVAGTLAVNKIICQDTLFNGFKSYGKVLGPMKLMFSPGQKTVFKTVSDILLKQDEIFNFTVKDEQCSMHFANGDYSWEQFSENKDAFINALKRMLRDYASTRGIKDLHQSTAPAFKELSITVAGANTTIPAPLEVLETTEKITLEAEMHNKLSKIKLPERLHF